MIIQKVKSEGLSHISYFIGQGIEAAVIDPRRDIDEYIQLAEEHEMEIKCVLETHRNEDYVIGSMELASRTGATVWHGGQVPHKYGKDLQDGQEILVGSLKLKALHTPGHTDESFSFVLYEPSADDHAVMVFCGDALFVNEVGRTDFNGPEQRERLAGALYDSIHNRILPLGDGVMLCPAHGAGSVCGTSIGEREESTLGLEKLNNPMLPLSRMEFIQRKKAEDLEIAPLMKYMEKLNSEGPPLLGNSPAPRPLGVKDMKHAIVKGSFLLDVRMPYSFAGAHIPGAVNLWLDGVPNYIGFIVPAGRPIVAVLECPEQLDLLVRRLVRLGYDDIKGYLHVGMDQWSKQGHELSSFPMITAKELDARIKANDVMVIDVRDKREMKHGRIPTSKAVHLGEVAAHLKEIPKNRFVVAYCGSGYRGCTAASLLRRNGYPNVSALHGGFGAWVNAGLEVEK